jgi:hypothetical protein
VTRDIFVVDSGPKKMEQDITRADTPEDTTVHEPTSKDVSTKNTVHCVCIAEFDIIKGNTLSHSYPPEVDIQNQYLLSDDGSAPINIADMCLPDGSHVFEEDTTYLFLPVKNDMQNLQLEDGQDVIFGMVCFRNKKDPTVKRGAVQKSIVLFTSKANFVSMEPILQTALNRIMDEGDNFDAVLRDVYETINNAKDAETIELWGKYFALYCQNIFKYGEFEGVSLIDLVKRFGRDTMLIWYALLLESRIAFIGTPAKLPAQLAISCPTLVKPLYGFTNRINPYVSLTNVDGVIVKPSFILGATNRLFETRSEWWDLCADVVTGEINISKVGNLVNVKLSSSDTAHMNRVIGGIERGESEGILFLVVLTLQDWVREQFRSYTSRFLRECVDRGLGSHSLVQIGQFGNMLLGGIDPTLIPEIIKKPNFLQYHAHLVEHSQYSDGESPLQFQISEAHKRTESRVPYFVYGVTYDTKLPQYHIQTKTVYRRFRDFVWLRDRLQRFFPGVVVPAIPEKSAINASMFNI